MSTGCTRKVGRRDGQAHSERRIALGVEELIRLEARVGHDFGELALHDLAEIVERQIGRVLETSAIGLRGADTHVTKWLLELGAELEEAQEERRGNGNAGNRDPAHCTGVRY